MNNIFNFNHLNNFDSFLNIDLFIYSLILLSIGSFASSIIFRFSLNLKSDSKSISMVSPRSFCPKCKESIKLIHLTPLLGFLIQKGRCNSCKKNISIFYPITEISFLLYGLVVAFFYGFGVVFFFLLVLFFLFYILFFLDLKYYYLPLSINLLLILCGFLGNIFFNIFVTDIAIFFGLSPFLFSLYGFLFGYMSLWFINFIFKFIRKKDGIGGGDFILFGAIGGLFGPFSLGLILFLGALFGCFIFIFFKNSFQDKIPLGSCLILGSFSYFFIKNFELLEKFLVI